MGAFVLGVLVANRTTKVTLKAQVNEYVEGMKKAADETRTVGLRRRSSAGEA